MGYNYLFIISSLLIGISIISYRIHKEVEERGQENKLVEILFAVCFATGMGLALIEFIALIQGW